MNIVKQLKSVFKFSQVRFFVQHPDPNINQDVKHPKIPNICENPENIKDSQNCKVTIQGDQVKSTDNLRIKVQVKSCREINGVIAYI